MLKCKFNEKHENCIIENWHNFFKIWHICAWIIHIIVSNWNIYCVVQKLTYLLFRNWHNMWMSLFNTHNVSYWTQYVLFLTRRFDSAHDIYYLLFDLFDDMFSMLRYLRSKLNFKLNRSLKLMLFKIMKLNHTPVSTNVHRTVP